MPTLPVEDILAHAIQQHQAGRLAEAEALYRQVLTLHPNHPDAMHNLGVIAHQAGRHELAIDLMRRAMTLNPRDPAIACNLGEVYRTMGRGDEAIAAYQRALQLKPDFAEVYNNWAHALSDLGRFDEAISAGRRALQLQPDLPDAHLNLGNALTDLGRFEEAAAAYDRALQLRPHFDSAKFNQGLLSLLRGDFARGWPLYEARWPASRVPERAFLQPRWDGRELHGQRILVHAEQGFGDALQFIRYARLVADRGGEVLVECRAPLVDLFRTAGGVAGVVAAGEPLPPFDLHVPMLSLPLIFQTTAATIPQEVPYLSADPVRRAIWRDRLSGHRNRWKVGFTWLGNRLHSANRARSLALSQLLPLLTIEGADFFSLQVDRGAEEIQRLSGAPGIIDHTSHLRDFADTAAFMAELDLIVSVDTSVVHLAGALSRPVWTLLQFVPDWRWELQGGQTPWYPTMRLFRQPTLGAWDAVIQQAATELAAAVRKSP